MRMKQKIKNRIYTLFRVGGGVGLMELSDAMSADGLRSRTGKKYRRAFSHRILKGPFYMIDI